MPLSFLDLPYYHLNSLHAFTRFALSSLHINSWIRHFNPSLSTTSFSWLLDHRYGRSSFIIALYWRSGLGMLCRNLYFLRAGSVKMIGNLKEACGNSYPQQRMFAININTVQGEFFLVHLFYSASFCSVNSIKGTDKSTIIRLTFFCEFDVNSTC